MVRTLSFAFVMKVAIGTTALAPTSASAWGFRGAPHEALGLPGGVRGWGFRGWVIVAGSGGPPGLWVSAP